MGLGIRTRSLRHQSQLLYLTVLKEDPFNSSKEFYMSDHCILLDQSIGIDETNTFQIKFFI